MSKVLIDDPSFYHVGITVPTNGDLIDATQSEVGLQQLADRTTINHLLLTQNDGVSKSVVVSPLAASFGLGEAGVAPYANAWRPSFSSGGIAIADLSDSQLHFDLRQYMREGAMLTNIDAIVQSGVGALPITDRMKIEVSTATPNFNVPAAPVVTTQVFQDFDSSTNIHVLTAGLGPEITMSSASWITVAVVSHTDPASPMTPDSLYALRLTFRDVNVSNV